MIHMTLPLLSINLEETQVQLRTPIAIQRLLIRMNCRIQHCYVRVCVCACSCAHGKTSLNFAKVDHTGGSWRMYRKAAAKRLK
eukprot:3798273-Amphidinium_carterae.1